MSSASDFRIFFTGATGYLGGDAWFTIIERHPDWESRSTLLARNVDRGKLIAARYPGVRVVYGDLSDSTLLKKEASEADIVVHCASIEDPASSQAIADGLAERSRNGPAFWICLSGTDNITWKTLEDQSYGRSNDQVYEDFDKVSEVINMPDTAPHHDVEKIQLGAASDKVRVAIVCAPCVYGVGKGPGNQRSIQLPDLAKFTLEKKYAFRVGEGLNRWPNVHVHDLSRLLLTVVEEATQGGGRATWGNDGYYFAENGEHVWGELAQQVADEAAKKGLVSPSRVVSLSAEDLDKHLDFGALFYGTDSRCKAVRARRVLSWEPREHSIQAEVDIAIAEEAKKSTQYLIKALI